MVDYAQVRSMFQDLVNKGAIGKDVQLFESVKESFIAQDLNVEIVNELTPAGRALLERYGVDVKIFESRKGDTTQKVLMQRLFDAVNRSGQAAQTCRDKAVDKYTTTLAQDVTVAQQAIEKGNPYQALAWTKLSEVVDQATHVAIAGVKGVMHGLKYSAQFYSDPSFDPLYTADQFLEIGGFCIKACQGDPHTFAKIQSMCVKFAQLSPEKQIEESIALLLIFLIPIQNLLFLKI